MRVYIYFLFFFPLYLILSQELTTIEWTNSSKYVCGETIISTLNFKGSKFDFSKTCNNIYYKKIAINFEKVHFDIHDVEFADLDSLELSQIQFADISNEIAWDYHVSTYKKQNYLHFEFVPFRVHDNKIQKVISFRYHIKSLNSNSNKNRTKYTNSSVLSSGKWHKIAVVEEGVHEINGDFLIQSGIDISSINPKNIRIYGNKSGVLNEGGKLEINDLLEIPIYVNSNEETSFSASDKIIFFGQSPHTWSYSNTTNLFEHKKNIYSDTTYYFLCFDLGLGKRIQKQPKDLDFKVEYLSSSYDDYFFYENDLYNLVNSGRQFFGESFSFSQFQNFSYDLQNIDLNSPINLKARFATRSNNYSYFNILYNQENLTSVTMPPVGDGSYSAYYVPKETVFSITPNSNNLNLTFSYNNNNNSSALAWLDYFSISYRRNLFFDNNQIVFRDINTINLKTKYSIISSTNNLNILDVTDPINVFEVDFFQNSNVVEFQSKSVDGLLREFVIFNNNDNLQPTYSGVVPNQNIHGYSDPSYIIVTHPDFLEAANRLANFHIDNYNEDVLVVTTEEVYNEFSTGSQDVSAIRNLVKFFYDNSSNPPKNLLLFGDASFDYKNILSSFTNYVPTYQSYESNSLNSSYCTDDYFGVLDDSEGIWNGNGTSSSALQEDIDIGIGRIPVQSLDNANAFVSKVINYHSPNSFGSWKNNICFVADDVDKAWERNLVIHADELAEKVESGFPYFNISKIYTDSYDQSIVSGGQRYPGARNDIVNMVERGSFIINYVGHGGETGWASERILELSDINNFTNYNKLPVFVTATCEFTRYDDAERTSAGEYLINNPNGGAIGLFSTSRSVGENSTYNLVDELYNYLPDRNLELSFGEILMKTKNNEETNSEKRHFSFFGDPNLKLSHPQLSVNTVSIDLLDTISKGSVNSSSMIDVDTVSSLSHVKISGDIRDENNVLTQFSGALELVFYDKPTRLTTLNNENILVYYNDTVLAYPIDYTIKNNIIFKGRASVFDGHFSIDFIVPKDLNYDFGNGHISYYAHDSLSVEATGAYQDVYVGGVNENYLADDIGPKIQLFLNDTNFVSGSYVNNSPTLLALIFDESGINTVGTGIGHNLRVVIDEDFSNQIIVNDYYEGDLNTFQSGRVIYPFSNLIEGEHTLNFKAWDVHNNSSDASISFFVTDNPELAIQHLFNFPNPATNYTRFVFDHNRPDEELELKIDIFSLDYRLIESVSKRVYSTGFRNKDLDWQINPCIEPGIYIYRLVVKSTLDNSISEKSEKLIILR